MKTSNPTFFLKTLTVIILLSTAGWIWFTSKHSTIKTGGIIPAPQEGFLVPRFELSSLDNQDYSNGDLNGKVTVINFWATWCPPCRKEMPAFQNIVNSYSSDDVLVIGINATNQDKPDAVGEFVQEFSLTFPILIDESGEVYTGYQISSLPTTFIVDRNGIIDKKIIGGPLSETLLKAHIDTLLEEE